MNEVIVSSRMFSKHNRPWHSGSIGGFRDERRAHLSSAVGNAGPSSGHSLNVLSVRQSRGSSISISRL